MRSDVQDHVHDLAAAYALDALDELERARFERHLDGCSACTREVRDFAETAAWLGAAAAVQPPPGLHDRVLDAIGRTRQLSPRHSPGRRLVTLRRAAVGAVAAAALAAGITAVVVPRSSPVTPDEEVASVLAAPDTEQVALEASDTGRGTWLSSAAEDAGVLVVSDLPAAPQGWTYQVWLSRGGEMQSAGLLPADGILAIDGAASDAVIALTLEHEGGAPEPTGPIVIRSGGA